jgi:xanthine/CO dehydrogenase XdhC/CoxF family maturation factor
MSTEASGPQRPANTTPQRRDDELMSLALDWLAAGRRVALATVIETTGSSPRPVGSHLIIGEDGAFEGSVSGGCVEGAVVSAAKEVIGSGEPALLDFGYSDEEAWEVGLACGGSVRVWLERLE